mgnify:FL=1
MSPSYTVQAVGQYGEPGEDRMFSDSVVSDALEWIKGKFDGGAPRVHVWHAGGRRIATLKSPPPPVQSLRDLLLFDAVAQPSLPTETLLPSMRRTHAAAAPAIAPKPTRPASNGAMPDLAQMLTEAVAEERGN